jgi:hypothetical protein
MAYRLEMICGLGMLRDFSETSSPCSFEQHWVNLACTPPHFNIAPVKGFLLRSSRSTHRSVSWVLGTEPQAFVEANES